MDIEDKDMLTKQVTISSGAVTEIFAAIGSYKVHEIYGIELMAGGTGTTVDVQKKGDSTDYVAKGVNVNADNNQTLPEQLNSMKEPFVKLEGGQGLQAIEGGTAAVECTVYYKKKIR